MAGCGFAQFIVQAVGGIDQPVVLVVNVGQADRQLVCPDHEGHVSIPGDECVVSALGASRAILILLVQKNTPSALFLAG
jgi:hypothetical protein